ncbi:Uncharacterised protein [Haemophilus parahaemolyticus]|uniref:Terminase small subunit n=1 Tax=Haemophilus parahaemolyticus TaxID=735 RepID=A0A377HXT4_HAEPH|nr:hypothetical protein [Haemophilus parahaemolyticus]STO63035.1 Uncharacterised protein [Haemophilus parahaemolyticus]
MSEQGIRAQFAKAYAQKGIAKLALVEALGKERADKMNPHTLRARASELLNDYLTVVLIEQEKKAMRERGQPLPKYRRRTYRADLMAEKSQ